MEKQQKYSIYAEGHFLQSVSPAELRMIHCLISDFFNKEDKIPIAGMKVNAPSENRVFIAKDICFDTFMISHEYKGERACASRTFLPNK